MRWILYLQVVSSAPFLHSVRLNSHRTFYNSSLKCTFLHYHQGDQNFNISIYGYGDTMANQVQAAKEVLNIIRNMNVVSSQERNHSLTQDQRKGTGNGSRH